MDILLRYSVYTDDLPNIIEKTILTYACSKKDIKCVLHDLFVCLLGDLRPTRRFYTHVEMSPLPVKGCKF